MSDYQHYVPRFYLKGFLDSSSLGHDQLEPFLWVADTKSNSTKKRAPKNIAGYQSFYDVSTERFQGNPKTIDRLLTVIETQTAPIIRKIRNNQFQTTIEERYHLATFIGIQLGRVPTLRRFLDEFLEVISNAWLLDLARDGEKLRDQFGEAAVDIKESILAGRMRMSPKFENEAHRRDLMISLPILTGVKFAELIFGMRWVFLLASDNAAFFTSDNPSRLMSPDAKPLRIRFGELNEELEVSFPVSSRCVLWMHSRDITKNPYIGENELIEIDRNTADELNWAILPTVDRYAFCPTEKLAQWVLAYIGKAKDLAGPRN